MPSGSFRRGGSPCLLCSSGNDPAVEAQRIAVLAERQIDGLLISPCSQEGSAPALAEIAQSLPVVQFDERVPSVRTPFVGVDDIAGISDVIAHVVAAGSRRLAFVGAGSDTWSGQRRRRGFEKWARESDPEALERMALGGFSREFGRTAAARLLAEDPRHRRDRLRQRPPGHRSPGCRGGAGDRRAGRAGHHRLR